MKHSVPSTASRQQKARATMIGFFIMIAFCLALLCASFILIRGNFTLGEKAESSVTALIDSASAKSGAA